MSIDCTRNDKIEIRVTEQEKKQIRRLAKEHELDMSKYGRRKMLNSLKVKH